MSDAALQRKSAGFAQAPDSIKLRQDAAGLT
jgi:hypothetical protein